jgi:Smr domain
MHIGDKVRLIRGKEEGVITRLLQNNVVEVEIEDGFKLPIMRSELVVISPAEAQFFKAQKPIDNHDALPVARTGAAVRAEKGIFMAFVPLNDRELSLHFINNTDWDLPYSLNVTFERHCRGLSGGFLKAKSSIKVSEFAIKDFDTWGTFTLHCLYYTVGYAPEREPLTKRTKFRPDTFFKSKKPAPLLGRDAYLFQMDEEEMKPIQPQELKAKMFEKNEPVLATKAGDTPNINRSSVVDLHIEKLTPHFLALSSSTMLELQLKAFEQEFDKALVLGLEEITFIHGAGNGVLRNEVHRKLSGHPHVQFFEDAQKEKFGYGATKVKIK